MGKDKVIHWGREDVQNHVLSEKHTINDNKPKTIYDLAKDEKIKDIKIEKWTVDIMRARLRQMHKSEKAVMAQFDIDGTGSGIISAEELEMLIPLALDVEEVPEDLIEACFDIFDPDLTGNINIK